MVDGCGRLRAIWRMVLRYIAARHPHGGHLRHDLGHSGVRLQPDFISSVQKMTVSVGVPVALVRGDVYYWGSLMAACLITSIPIAIVYNLLLDRFIAGFTVGAVK
jgi:ABC-type glycerol-3-phosphate transport system permease component